MPRFPMLPFAVKGSNAVLGWGVCLSVIAALLFGGCGRSTVSETPVPETVGLAIATVGDRVITEFDILQEAERRQRSGLEVPDKMALVKAMVEHAALVQRALADGINDDPGVKRAMDDLMIAQWRDRQIEKGIVASPIGDAELKQAYEKRQDEFNTPAKVRLAVLTLSTSPHMSEARLAEVEARMVEAREKALSEPAPKGLGAANSGFGALAIDYSDDTATRYRGGDMGWLDEGNFKYRWPTRVLEIGYALEKGALSDVLKESDGYYIVMKTDDRPGVVRTFESVQEPLRRKLQIERQNRLRMDMHNEAIASFPAVIDEAKLAQLKLPQFTQASIVAREDVTSRPPNGGIAP